MKIKLICGAVAAMGMLAINANAASKCWFWQTECKVKEVLEDLTNGKEPTPNVQAFCRKGVAKEGIFSVRSFEGAFCKKSAFVPTGLTEMVVGLSQMICPDVATDWKDSQCNKEGQKILKDSGMEAMELFNAGQKKLTGKVFDMGCSLAKANKVSGAGLVCGEKEKPAEKPKAKAEEEEEETMPAK